MSDLLTKNFLMQATDNMALRLTIRFSLIAAVMVSVVLAAFALSSQLNT